MDSTRTDWSDLSRRLNDALHLAVTPVGITFSPNVPTSVPRFAEEMSEPAPDGRAGRVPAGCVFWVEAAEQTFATVPEDHGNCSVGQLTHGFAELGDVVGNDDVSTLLASGWVSAEQAGAIPRITERPAAITYGPLGETPADLDPDVVLLRVNGRQMMVLSDALPALRIEGKPQCHIVALAKQQKIPAASVGCALSRARTGMTPDEMTCALPGAGLSDIVEAVERAVEIDTSVAKYAATDARRFS